MERHLARERLNLLIGQDLRQLADQLNITVFKNDKKNKGWAGHTIERYLGLPLNSAQSPNFGSWELKMCSLKYLKNGSLTIKETMAITMIDEYNIRETNFENSHLFNKMQKILIPARIWESAQEKRSILYSVVEFDLNCPEVYQQIKDDYDLIKNTVINKGFSALSGRLGRYVQPRTKGAGHGSKSRAFYVRTDFLKGMIFGN